MIPYIENYKDTTKKTIRTKKLIQWFSGYKVNIQKFVVFLYTNKLSGREVKKTIPFTMHQKE